MKKSSLLIYLVLFSISIFLFSSCGNYGNREIKFVESDTLVFPGKSVKKSISYLDSYDNSEIMAYFDYQNDCLVQWKDHKIYQEIDFGTLFSKPGNLRLYQHFFYTGNKKDFYLLATPVTLLTDTDKQKEILREYFFIRIDSNKQITDTIKITNNTSKNFYIQSPLYQLPIISNEDSMVFVSPTAVTSQPGETQINDYQINTNSRLKMFSQDCAILIVIKNNGEAYFMSKNIAYPKVLLDTNISFYDYFPSVVGNSSQEVISVYRDLDTIYAFNIANLVLKKHHFQSKYFIPFVQFDKDKIFDYDYLSLYGNAHKSNLYLKYNLNNKQTYIIIKRPTKYENEDGTINKASENPFAVIVLDSNYTQIGEFDIPSEYIKHDCFAYGNGIAFLNAKLSEEDVNGFLHYVVFETKKN